MARDRYSSSSYTQASSKSLLNRALTVVMIITGITLLVLARGHHPLVTNVRTHVMEVVDPVVGWLTQPVTGIRNLLRDKDALLNAYEDNAKLKAENDTLRHWQAVAQSLKAENDSLRALAGYNPVAHVSYVTARVVTQSPGGYSASLTINAGAAEGVKPLQPVVDSYGLIGRVTEVGEHTSRVLLLSDSASRVPVVTATARLHALAAGTGASDELLRLTFVGGDGGNTIALGDQVVTTEEGGLIPGGIIIGTVFRRDSSGLLVKPARPLAESEYVRIIVTK